LSTAEVSEIFYSLEGEHVETGMPTVYIRFARCNKKCPLWNNTQEGINTAGYADLGFEPSEYNILKDLPMIVRGCDSQYAVNPRFAHIWKKYEPDELLQAVLDLLPGKSWKNPRSGLPVILSLTGGEPTLKMRWIVDELLKSPLIKGCKHILFETNCSVPLRTDDIEILYEWAMDEGAKISWVNSPKLSDSGESWKRSIMPSVAMQQRNYIAFDKLGTQGFKFVVGQYDDLFEVEKAMNEYYDAGVPRNVAVSLMPEACTAEQQDKIAGTVAQLCMDYGYRFSIRLQSVLWQNAVST
jgi:7-carboxy-7-deazaguanine synthase